MNAATTVGKLVVERPGRARVLERLGLDYCCGGGKSLSESCQDLGLDVEVVLRDIAKSDAASPGNDAANPADLTLTQLADQIEATHHAYLRLELPRISGLAGKVAQAHGENHPQTHQVQRVFEALRTELEAHMQKEEVILFPMCRQLEGSSEVPAFHCGSLRNPIAVMEHEHDNAGRALAEMRKLTADYATPPDVCNTYRALMDALAGLEADLHQHIHKENNILFPRTVELEARLAA